MRTTVTTILCIICFSVSSYAQKERGLIRSGNRQYEAQRYVEAEIKYKEALEKNPASYEAAFNLGTALYKQERYDAAEQVMSGIAPASNNKDHEAWSYFNMGNAQLKQRKLKEAIESYKKSLRINPDDMDAKFNLAYAKKLLEQENNPDQQDQDKDQNKDQNKDQDKDQNKDKDKNNDGSDQQKDQQQDQQKNGEGDQKKDPNQQNRPEDKEGMSQQQAQQLLNAMQSNEDRTRQKLKDQKEQEAVGIRSKKNW